MASLLQNGEVLSALVSNLLSVVTHALGHLLELMVVIVHRLLTFLICVPNFRQTPLEDSFGLLHFALALRLLPRNAHTLLFLHIS